MKSDGIDGYQKLPIKFTSTGTDTYTIVDGISGHTNNRFMEESGKIFSDHDVDISGRNWLEGIKLVATGPGPSPSSSTNFDNRIFKIKLKNDNTFYHVASSDSF